MKQVYDSFLCLIFVSKILAEIKVCCSQPATDCQPTELKPLSFEKGPYSLDTDIDSSVLFCETIKQDISVILRKKEYFRQAWTQHFNMEVHILEERFRNSDGELELDGREEDLMERVSVEIENDAADCCEKLRPLLDRIMVIFGVNYIFFRLRKDKSYKFYEFKMRTLTVFLYIILVYSEEPKCLPMDIVPVESFLGKISFK